MALDVRERTGYVIGVIGFAIGLLGLVGGEDRLRAPAAAAAAACVLLFAQHWLPTRWRLAVWLPFFVTTFWLVA